MSQTPSLPRSTPEAQGISSLAIQSFLAGAVDHGLELHSFMLVRHGHVVAAGWWEPYTSPALQLLYSLSKSFTSTAIGLAVEEGRLSIDDKVVSFFSDDLTQAPSENLAAMRVRDLLTMTTGHEEDTTAALQHAPDGNWAKAFFAQPVGRKPGTHFVYNSGATYMLSAILQKLTGETLLDYLRPRLLDPLGIGPATWQSDPRGINVGGWGMSITTEAIARFGQLYLQHGVWNDEQLVPAAWVEAATRKQVPNDQRDAPIDWEQGYGYQFWRCRHNAYRGDGAFGQFCIVLPEHDAVIAITSAVDDMQAVLDTVWQHILPAFQSAALPANDAQHAKLEQQTAELALLPPAGAESSPVAERVSGQTFTLEPNELGYEAVTCSFGETTSIIVRDARGEHLVVGGTGAWYRDQTTLDVRGPQKTASAGAWTDEHTFVMVSYFYQTPHAITLRLRFEGDQVLFDFAMNYSFGPTTFPQMHGHGW